MTGRVLIVEDETAIADLVRAYLEREGFEPLWVRSGEDALVELSRNPVRFVILDIGLPGIDGFEVCRRLRARTSVPILMLSAREDEIDRVAGLEAGADDYVVKPFSPPRADREDQGDPAARSGRRLGGRRRRARRPGDRLAP